MPPAEKPFYSVEELAERWAIPAFDLGSYAVEGTLTLSIVMSRPARAATAGKRPTILKGLIPVIGLDVWPAFRGMPVTLTRVAVGKGERLLAPDGPAITVTLADLVLTRAEKRRFETESGLSSEDAAFATTPTRRPKIGSPVQYKWDRCWAAICHRVHDEGMPESRRAMTRTVLDWFATHEKEIPDERTIRRKVEILYAEFAR